jgi:hypothetical protein
MQFIAPSLPKYWEWLTINFGINATRDVIPRFTTLEQRDYKMITSNFVNQRLTWQYKRKLG